MRGRTARLAATMVAIVAGVAFAAATLVVTASLRASAEEAVAAPARASDVVVTPAPGADPTPVIAGVGQVDGVRAVVPVRDAYVDIELGSGPTLANVQSLPEAPELRTATLATGRWPAAAGEVVVDGTTAAESGLGPGSVLTLYPEDRAAVAAPVVGTVDLPSALGGSIPTILAADAEVAAWSSTAPASIYVLGSAGADDVALREAISAEIGPAATGVVVRTGAEQVARDLDAFTGGSDVLSVGLWAAALVALAVTALVIANTFQVVVAQRTQEFALLRCVGSRRGQVFQMVLMEAALIGSIGSVTGVITGGAAGVGLTRSLAESDTGLFTESVLPIGTLLAAGLVGVVTTVLAALAPARTAARHSPLQALRGISTSAQEPRSKPGWTVAGVVLFGLGVAGLWLGAGTGASTVVVAGGVGCLMGALLLTRPALALTLRLARRPLARLGGPAGQLAWANLVRNPRRMAASSTALLIGVTLVATVLVGAATTRATLASEIDTRYPVDAEVLALRGPLPNGLEDVLAATPGVVDVAVVPGTTVQIGGVSRPVLGIDEAALDTSRGELAEPAPGQLVLPPAVARNAGVAEGELITLSSGAAAVELRAELSSADLGSPLISSADLARLDPAPAARAIWIRTAPDSDAARVTEQIRTAVANTDAQAILNGAVRLRDAYQSALDTAGLVALGLLAVSVAIAMIGITNTLTLSVLERGRESALLRALGMTRRRLRACLAWEAVVLSLAAVIGGIGLGSALGVAGSYALLEFGPRTVPELPIAQLAGVAVVATALAAVASTLPAHIALRTPPARALTAE